MKKKLSNFQEKNFLIEYYILVALSDFQPHNQNQIADLIGNNHKKSTDRVNVSRCLKELETYLVRVPNVFGESGNRRVLKQDIQTLGEIAKKYPSIILDWQKNDKIRDILQDMHPEFCGPDTEFTPETMANLRDFPLRFRSYPGRVVMFKDVLIPLIKASEQGFKDDFKEYLRESPTFFKLCLLHDSEHLKEKAVGVHYAFLSAIVEDKEKVKTQCDSASGYMLNNSFYWFCRLVDVLEL